MGSFGTTCCARFCPLDRLHEIPISNERERKETDPLRSSLHSFLLSVLPVVTLKTMDSVAVKKDVSRIIKLEKEHELRFEVDFDQSVIIQVRD